MKCDYVYFIMEEKELRELFDIIESGFDNGDWNSISQAMDFISEFIDIEEDEY